MNQKLLSGLTATFLATAFGASSLGNVKPAEAVDQGSETNPKVATSPSPTSAVPATIEVVKVGEQQSSITQRAEGDVIAKIQAHALKGHKAATLYVRNIPVLTFVGSAKDTSDDVKLGTQVPDAASGGEATAAPKSLERSEQIPLVNLTKPFQNSLKFPVAESDATHDPNDPVWRASEVAAKLNQINRDGIDASKITVKWDEKTGQKIASNPRYLIKFNEDILATVDSETILPDTTRNLERDALQATNRLRRLLGNAEPLAEVSGTPSARGQTLAFGPLRIPLDGWASWYGPGFHGNQSASGEIFDQNALTAAHRTLPFGTQVMVTNLDNGQSVVVRINDRGPYHGNRIIDLSAAAARVLGVIHSGVAPVKLNVIDNRNSGLAGN